MALGALRAARRSDHTLTQAVQVMNEVVAGLGNPEFYVTALIARWYAATKTLSWINCGHPSAYVVDPDGTLRELTGPELPALGAGELPDDISPTDTRLQPGERLILVTDGITHRRTQDGGCFGSDGLQAAVSAASDASAPATTMAIQRAVTDSWREALEDDATVVVFAIS